MNSAQLGSDQISSVFIQYLLKLSSDSYLIRRVVNCVGFDFSLNYHIDPSLPLDLDLKFNQDLFLYFDLTLDLNTYSHLDLCLYHELDIGHAINIVLDFYVKLKSNLDYISNLILILTFTLSFF